VEYEGASNRAFGFVGSRICRGGAYPDEPDQRRASPACGTGDDSPPFRHWVHCDELRGVLVGTVHLASGLVRRETPGSCRCAPESAFF